MGYRRARDEVPSAADGWNALGEKRSHAKRGLSFSGDRRVIASYFCRLHRVLALVLLWLWVNQDESEN